MGRSGRSERRSIQAPDRMIERAEYLDSGRWQGKSGGYGVQDGDPFVTVVRGSFSNVVGLPMERLATLLRAYPRLTEWISLSYNLA